MPGRGHDLTGVPRHDRRAAACHHAHHTSARFPLSQRRNAELVAPRDAAGRRPVRRRGPDPKPLSLLALAPVGTLAVYLWDAGRADLPWSAATASLLALILTQIVPGVIVWRALRSGDGWWFEDITMGFSLGVALAIGAQSLAGWIGLRWVTALPALVIVGIAVLVPAARRRVVSARTRRLPWWWGPAVAAPPLLLIPHARAMYHAVPLDYPGFMAPYVDMPFHLSLAAELASRGPSSFPYVSGEPLVYHWFSHAWVAHVAQTAGVELDTVLYRLLPAITTVALVSVIAAGALRLSRRPAAGPIAAVIAVTTGLVSIARLPVSASIVKHLSPSLGLSSILLVGLLVVLLTGWRETSGPGHRILVGVLAVAVAGTKGSGIAVVLGGLMLTALLTWMRGFPLRRRVSEDAGIVTAAFLGTVLIVFRGAAQEVSLDPVASLSGAAPVRFLLDGAPDPSPSVVVLALGLLVVSVLAVGAGLAAAFSIPEIRKDPAAWLLLGIGATGAVAFGLLHHVGGSHSYFLANALPALAIGSGWGVSALLGGGGKRARRAVLVAAASTLLWWLLVTRLVAHPTITQSALPRALVGAGVVAAVMAVALLGMRGTGRLGAAAVTGLTLCLYATVPVVVSLAQFEPPEPAEVIPPDRPNAFFDGQIEAARWLRDNSAVDDIVATNRHCANPRVEECDSRRFFVAAYTERQVLVEGWAYTPRAVTAAVQDDTPHQYVPYWRPDVLAVNDDFLTSPTPALAEQLWELGVRWLFIDKVVEHADDFGDLAIERYASEYAAVYELRPPAGEETP